ncbi:hypothetical protein RB195_017740 [Necator americanus]|uniref:Uncharacterized protein n=1 Tax=Necator americanus TaxID=51031 RepID=A0ABR1C867_NECAM
MVWSRLEKKIPLQNRSEDRYFSSEATREAKDSLIGPCELDMINARLCTADAMDRTNWKTRSRKADPARTRDKSKEEEEEEMLEFRPLTALIRIL